MFNDFSLLLPLEVPDRREAPRLRAVASREEAPQRCGGAGYPQGLRMNKEHAESSAKEGAAGRAE